MTRRVSVIAACLLILAGCSVKLGDQVVDVFGGARPAPTPDSEVGGTPPPPPLVLSPPPTVPSPAPPPVVEDQEQLEPLPPAPNTATPLPAAVGIPGFISADRADFRPCPEQSVKCAPITVLRFNDEVRVVRLDPDDWAFVRVLRLNQDGYVLRTHIAPTRPTRPAGRPPAVSVPDPPGSSGKEPRSTGERKPQEGPKEELMK